MSNSDIIFYSHSPWSGVSSSLFILYRWFYAWYILVNIVCHVIVYSFWGKSWTLLCTLVLVDPYGRYYTYFPLFLKIISYTSFPMINCYSLIIVSFIALFSSSWVISHTHGGLHPLRWIYRSLKLFLLSWCLWPWELQIHVYWIVMTCSSEQVSSFFSCRRLYRTFPTIQMHQLHGYNYFLKHMHNDKFLCIMQLFSQYNIHLYLTEIF